jgi:hypothetical protein
MNSIELSAAVLSLIIGIVLIFESFVTKSLSPIGGLLALALMIVSLMITTALKIFTIESGIEETNHEESTQVD